MTTPYTYLIGWTKQEKYYYGVRYAKGCHPSDLWVTYFTSSKYVSALRKEYGEPDIVSVRRSFINPSDALKWEQKVLRRLAVLENSHWINCGIGGVHYVSKQLPDHIARRTTNKNHNPKQKEIALLALQKAVEANTGRKQANDTQIKKRETYIRNWAKNQISARRESKVQYIIDGVKYMGNKSVMEAFGITEPTIYNRVKNPKYNWERVCG